MLDTEQANARIKQLEDYIDDMTRRHGEELQKIDAQYLEDIDRLAKDNRDQIEMIENLQTELNQLKNQ
jgi:ribosome recycling factor